MMWLLDAAVERRQQSHELARWAVTDVFGLSNACKWRLATYAEYGLTVDGTDVRTVSC